MSSHRLGAVAQRKADLIARAAAQREAIAGELTAWQSRTRLIDRGMSLLRTVKAHPVLAGVAVAVLLFSRRASLMRWTGRLVMLWRGWRMLQGVLRTHQLS
jgi:hypothetical protein